MPGTIKVMYLPATFSTRVWACCACKSEALSDTLSESLPSRLKQVACNEAGEEAVVPAKAVFHPPSWLE